MPTPNERENPKDKDELLKAKKDNVKRTVFESPFSGTLPFRGQAITQRGCQLIGLHLSRTSLLKYVF
jgi:hypothetical protein